MMTFSIIICTYRRYDLVRNCLETIRNLEIPADTDLEVIVVENTPKKDRQPIEWVESYPKTRYVFQDQIGLSAARNAGIEAAQGEIVSFVDDDAELRKDWLIEMRRAFAKHRGALVIGGKVLAKFPAMPRPQWLGRKCEELLSCIDWGDRTRRLKSGVEWLVGANISYRSEVFSQFGRFGTNLGRKGETGLLSNEEGEFNSRLPQLSVYYCGSAVVDHLIPSERLTRDWFRKRVFWQAISDVLAGNIDGKMASRHFESYIDGLMGVPAEFRCARALFYNATEPDEFNNQLDQLFKHTVSFAHGTTSWPESA